MKKNIISLTLAIFSLAFLSTSTIAQDRSAITCTLDGPGTQASITSPKVPFRTFGPCCGGELRTIGEIYRGPFRFTLRNGASSRNSSSAQATGRVNSDGSFNRLVVQILAPFNRVFLSGDGHAQVIDAANRSSVTISSAEFGNGFTRTVKAPLIVNRNGQRSFTEVDATLSCRFGR